MKKSKSLWSNAGLTCTPVRLGSSNDWRVWSRYGADEFQDEKSHRTYPEKNRLGFRGYPIVSIAFYGPNNKIATKIVVARIEDDVGDVKQMERWSSSDGSDLRDTDDTMLRIDALLKEWSARSVVMPSTIIGCPHEEGIDYLEGESCPECPFWKNRNRWSGEAFDT